MKDYVIIKSSETHLYNRDVDFSFFFFFFLLYLREEERERKKERKKERSVDRRSIGSFLCKGRF